MGSGVGLGFESVVDVGVDGEAVPLKLPVARHLVRVGVWVGIGQWVRGRARVKAKVARHLDAAPAAVVEAGLCVLGDQPLAHGRRPAEAPRALVGVRVRVRLG